MNKDLSLSFLNNNEKDSTFRIGFILNFAHFFNQKKQEESSRTFFTEQAPKINRNFPG